MYQYSFTSLSRLRFQVVPANKLEKSRFNEYLNELQKLQEVRLTDLTPVKGLFNPQGYPQGRIVYNFESTADTESLILHDFEPHRKTFGCIAIVQWEEGLQLDQIRDQLNKEYTSFISNYLLIFGTPEDLEKDSDLNGIYYIDQPQIIETTICDLTSDFLGKLSTYVSSFQHVTLRSPGSIVGSSRGGSPAELTKKMTGSFETSGSEKSRMARNNGRRLKLFANFYLLAGRFKDALINICEAIPLLKQTMDSLWLASALECLAVCIILLSYLEAPFSLPSAITSIIESTKDTPFTALRSPSPSSSPRNSMQSTSSTTNSTSTPVLQTYTPEATIDLVSKIINKSMFYYKATVSQGDEQVPMIVFIESNLRYIRLLTAVNVEGEANFQVIRNTVNPRYSLESEGISKLGDTNVNQILSCITNIFGAGFKNITASQKCSVYNCLISIYSSLQMNRKKSFLLKELLDVINSARILNSKEVDYHDVSSILNSLIAAYRVSSKDGSFIMQKKVLILIFNFCGKLDDKAGVLEYGSLLFKKYRDTLTEDEQNAIYKRLSYYSSKSGQPCEYWDEGIMVSFEVNKLKKAFHFIEGETAEAILTLRNAFSFPVEVTDLKVSTKNGFLLNTNIHSKYKSTYTGGDSTLHNMITIKPNSEIQLPLLLTPLNDGKLCIDGIEAKVCNCKLQTFKFEKPSIVDVQRWKDTDQVDDITKDLTTMNLGFKVFEYDVLYKQPFLSVVDVNLDDKWFMLLEGECKKFQVHLKNVSNVDINQMALSFLDSTVEPLQALLFNKNIPQNEIYEIEYYLIKKQAFKVLNKHEMTVIPGGKDFVLDIEVWGKRGIKEACLLLEYSHQNENKLVKFYRTISVPVNISVYTSVELAGCDVIPLSASMDINKENDNEFWKYLQQMVKKGYSVTDFCLLALDLNNEWNQKMEINLFCLLEGSTIENFQESNHLIKDFPKDTTFTYKGTIPAKKSSRVLVPVKRINFSHEKLARRIPSLRNKQFVKDYKTPQEEQKFIQHAFWYRDELLKRLKASWKIANEVDSDDLYSGRYGEVDLRSIRFSSRDINIIEVEKIELNLRILNENNVPFDTSTLQLNTFYTIEVKISNRDVAPVTGLIRHIPMSKSTTNSSIDKKILFNGVLQYSINQIIEPGESKTFEMGIVFLERGEYQWGFMFDEMTGLNAGHTKLKQQHVYNEQLILKVVK